MNEIQRLQDSNIIKVMRNPVLMASDQESELFKTSGFASSDCEKSLSTKRNSSLGKKGFMMWTQNWFNPPPHLPQMNKA